jgi:hypothetical protein
MRGRLGDRGRGERAPTGGAHRVGRRAAVRHAESPGPEGDPVRLRAWLVRSVPAPGGQPGRLFVRHAAAGGAGKQIITVEGLGT